MKVWVLRTEFWPVFILYKHDDYGGKELDIPQELFDRLKKASDEFDAAQDELKRFLENS